MAVPDRPSCSRGEAGSQSVTHHTVLERLPDFSCISWACAFRAEDGESIYFCGPVEAEGGTSALSRRASSSGIPWRIFSLVKWTVMIKRTACNRFDRDDKEPGPSWGNQVPGKLPHETAETRHTGPQPSRNVQRKGAAPQSSAEEQTARAISTYAQ
jgi:hypothetical protein